MSVDGTPAGTLWWAEVVASSLYSFFFHSVAVLEALRGASSVSSQFRVSVHYFREVEAAGLETASHTTAIV